MKREIKFRGIVKYSGDHFHSGDFIKGYFFKDVVTDRYYIKHSEIDQYGNVIRVVDVEVMPKTVGQYTGLKDKDGKEIYEGDILSKHYKTGNVHEVCNVKFANGCFCGWFDHEEDAWFNLYGDNHRHKIIGNIHIK